MVILRDREKLTSRYIPSSLPHRDEEIQRLRKMFSEVLPRRGQSIKKPVQVIGSAGTWKTSICLGDISE